MAGLPSRHDDQTNIESPNLTNQGSEIPHHLMTPQLQNPNQSLMNNWTQFSTQNDDVLSMHKFVPANSSTISTVLEAALDERHIQESLKRANVFPYQLQHYAMNGPREQNYGGYNNHQTQLGGYPKLIRKRTSIKTSVFRGVTKCHDERFEAFVWDNTGEKGRTVYIGGFSNEIEAARAHDLVSLKIGGLEATTNFPVRFYLREIQEMQHMSRKEYILAVRRGKGNNSDTPYRGVYRIKSSDTKNWEARLGKDKGIPGISLGTYYTADDAARAYDIVSIRLKGTEAITNFELYSYDVKGIIESVRHLTLRALLKKISDEASSCSSLDQRNSKQLLSQQLSNSSSSFHGYQNPNPILSSPYILGGLNGAGSQVGTNGNSIGEYYGAMFPNNGFHLNLMNNQFQHQQNPNLPFVHGSQNLQFQNSTPSLSNWPISGFGKRLLGGNIEPLSNALNGGSSRYHTRLNRNPGMENCVFLFGSQSKGNQYPVLESSNQGFEAAQIQQPLRSNALNGKSPMYYNMLINETQGAENGVCSFGLQSNQEIEAAQLLQVPALDQSYEPFNNYANTLNQNPHESLNSSCFSNSFQNPCSEPNTGSQSQMTETQDDDDFDISQYLNSSYMEENDCAGGDF